MDTLSLAPWWTQIWIVQETILTRKATVVYRYITVSCDMLEQAARTSGEHDNFGCEGFRNTPSLSQKTQSPIYEE
jgi:hypothetical protein